jgi:formiminoglutamase
VTFEALKNRNDLSSWGLLTLDAHHDVRPYRPGPPSNGSPVRALMDAGLPGTQIVQVGITGFSNVAAHRRWCEEIGVTVKGPREIAAVPELLDSLSERCKSIYVDLDIDVLDRAFAPGCPGARPGGINPSELFDAAFEAGSHASVRAVDIVEVDPERDIGQTTVFAGAIAMLNVAAGFSTRSRGGRET